jgi:hypothetical protein
MSNRFHNKWHRKNHHTYGNLTNPDAAHDPIASPDQPFLGDFSLQGALCAVAPASAFAGYFYSNNTALCAFAGNRGLLVEGLNTNSIGIEVDAKKIALSAYSPNLGVSVYSPNNALSAYGVERGIYSGSHKMGIQVSAGQTGIETTSPNLALIAGSPNVAIKAYSLNTPLSTAFGKNLMHGVVGINTDTITSGKVLEVKGDSKFVGNVNVTIDLDVDGDVNIDGGDLTASTSTFNLLNATVQTINFGSAATSIQMAKADNTSTVNINGTKDSTSLTTGALVVDGGVGIAKTLYVQDIVVTDDVNIQGDLDVDGDVNIDGGDLTASTSTFNLLNGTVQTINFGGDATSIQMAKADNTSTVNINGTKDSTSKTTGALVIDGGVGIAKTLTVEDIIVEDDVTIKGDLTVNGDFTYLNTEVQVTSAVLIENSGTGPALKVTQRGSNDIAQFIDDNTTSLIIKDGGNVGINTSSPSEKLTVNGKISANDDIILMKNRAFKWNTDDDLNDSASIGFYKEGATIDDGRLVFETFDNSTEPIIFKQSSNNRLSIGTNGNVAIGSSMPNDYANFPHTLTVYGNFGSPRITSGFIILSAVNTVTNNSNALVRNSTDGSIEQRVLSDTAFGLPLAPILKNDTFGLVNSDNAKTIIINSATTSYIILSATLNAGTSVSFIRKGTGEVIFYANPSVTINTAPTSDFKKIAFQNSLAGAYHEGSGNWFIYGDLLS